ncbi:C45 family autoproteolytic acyltransferase/hydolase [Buttiauxella sp.]|uniref:C45 family autoproteolytic acyltransferase/hydolase n=1 Tax=Buttiauxella sp. TaxID=1972222 RepID=UPI003C78516D
MNNFQFIKVCSESPYERGVQYGSQAKSKIIDGVVKYKKLFLETTGKSWEHLQGYIESYSKFIEKNAPDLLTEASGIANGAGVHLNEIMLLNCRYEITKFSSNAASTHECTTGALLSDTTRNNNIFMIKNWDYKPGIVENIVVIHIDECNGTQILGVAEAGQLIRDGINNHGVGIVNNNLKSIYDTELPGMPSTFLRRSILSCNSYDNALKKSISTKRTVSVNMMLVSDEDKAVDIEAYPEGCDFVKPINGIITHANHFTINPEINAKKSDDFMRDTRLRYLLGKKYKYIELETIKTALQDHEFYPLSLCGHDEPVHEDPMKGRTTVASMIFDLTEKKLYVSKGCPCTNAYNEYSLFQSDCDV